MIPAMTTFEVFFILIARIVFFVLSAIPAKPRSAIHQEPVNMPTYTQWEFVTTS